MWQQMCASQKLAYRSPKVALCEVALRKIFITELSAAFRTSKLQAIVWLTMAEAVQTTMEQTDALAASGSTFQNTLQQYAYHGPSSSSPLKRITRSSTNNNSTTPSPSPSSRKRRLQSDSTAMLPPSLPLKRESPGAGSGTPTAASPSSVPKKKKRPSSSYAPPSKYAALGNNLVDALTPGLICIFIGVNPGIRTATHGHAYSHPSNLFWKLLHSSGCTPRRCAPEEDRQLPELYELGHTNIVSRPTKDAAELSKQEMDEGVAILEEKIKLYKPESVALVGKGIWESVWRVKRGRPIKKEEFKYGWQDEVWCAGDAWEGARVLVATTTSGLGVSMRLAEMEEVLRGLGSWVAKRREERKRDREAVKTEDGEVAFKAEAPEAPGAIEGFSEEVREEIKMEKNDEDQKLSTQS